jgi:hypothetical protein
MTVTGHKSEASLKTYSGYTGEFIKRKMSDTNRSHLLPRKCFTYFIKDLTGHNSSDLEKNKYTHFYYFNKYM